MGVDPGTRAALWIAAGVASAAPAGPVAAAGYWPVAVGLVAAGALLVFQGLRTVRAAHARGADGPASNRERR